MSRPDSYKMTVEFSIQYSAVFDIDITGADSEYLLASDFAQDLLDGDLSVAKFDRKVKVEFNDD